MARLPQYWAPKTKITPSERGFNAFETAGRRIGGLYAETARSEEQASKLAGDLAYNAIEFPFLYGSSTSTGSVSAKVTTAGGPSSAFSLKPETSPDLSAANAAAGITTDATGAATPSPGGKAIGGPDGEVTVLRGGGTTALDRYTQTVGQLLSAQPSYTPPISVGAGTSSTVTYWPSSGAQGTPVDSTTDAGFSKVADQPSSDATTTSEVTSAVATASDLSGAVSADALAGF